MGTRVRRAFKFRFYPTDAQAADRARTEAWTLRQERVNFNTTSAFRYRDGALTLAKMAEPLNIVWSRTLPEGAPPSTVTVSHDPAGRWFVSFLCDDVIPRQPAPDAAVGVDAGLDHLLTLSTGEKISNLRHERHDRARLARVQREHSRKEKGSANRAKARLKIGRVHARIADRRRDAMHKLTRAISDAARRQFREMLEYKADWYGRTVIAVDRWFPSSKLCSTCGVLAEKMPLNVRKWTYLCGTLHDRDVNAARNILAEGLSVAACGGGVRPQRENSRTGQSPAKQETQRATAGIPRL